MQMKNTIMLIPVFFLNLLIWVIVCPFFYSLSQAELFQALADGNYGLFFSSAAANLFNFFPTAAVLAFSAVFVFIVRHRAEGCGGFFVFFAMLIFTFAVLEPASVKLKLNFERAKTVAQDTYVAPSVADGLIQEHAPGSKTVIFESSSGLGESVVVTAEAFRNASPHINMYSGRSASDTELDYEISQRLEMPSFLERLSQDIEAVHAVLSNAASSSLDEYLWIGGAFFALIASFFFLCTLTDWKLLNIVIYAIALRVLYRLFPLINVEGMQNATRRFLPQALSNAVRSALPALGVAVIIAIVGFAFILPRYRKRNPGGAES